MADFEIRTVTSEVETRDAGDGGLTIEGYASVFNTPYDLGPFWEQVSSTAFTRTLASKPDVRFLIDHQGQPIARSARGERKSGDIGVLDMQPDSTGLHVRAKVDPSDPDVQRLVPKMRNGLLDQMSFAFRVAPNGDSWDYGDTRTLRTLNEVSLAGGDVSVVTYPANPATSVSVRSAEHALLEARCLFVEACVQEFRAGRALSQQNIDKLKQVLALVASADDAVDRAQPVLADVLGVPNPDTDDTDDSDEAGDADEADDSASRSVEAVAERRGWDLTALNGIRAVLTV